MSASGLKVFDETLQVTNSWLKDLMEMLHTDDRQLAYRGLRAVLHALRDELEPELAVHLAAQLPMLVRGFYYEGWQPSRTPTPNRHLDAFYQAIRTEMHGHPEVEPDRLMGAVFDLLSTRIEAGEVQKVVRSLPREIRDLWGIPS
jgi:uncharacterized protein (DUF2267 family)